MRKMATLPQTSEKWRLKPWQTILLFGILQSAWVYLQFIRPWHLRWGATDEEVHRSMPGDDQVPHPMLKATRAITIKARATEIWPWLVQMGYKRAGWYSYDWIDNAGMHVNRVVPELQHIKVGDIMPTGPGGGFLVAEVDPNQSLVLIIRNPAVQISSAVVLDQVGEQQTRLIARLRLAFKPSLRSILYYLIFEPGDFVMMRKMLLGIKQRAERASEQTPEQVDHTEGVTTT